MNISPALGFSIVFSVRRDWTVFILTTGLIDHLFFMYRRKTVLCDGHVPYFNTFLNKIDLTIALLGETFLILGSMSHFVLPFSCERQIYEK